MFEEIKRLEQVWLVLSELFQDLSRRDIKVNVSSELRNCKTLIGFIRTSMAHPPKDPTIFDNSLRNLQEALARIQSALISAASDIGENYVKGWVNEIDRAERDELDRAMIHTKPEFVPGLPRSVETGWVRLTLKKPMEEERVQDVAERFGVLIEVKDDHIIITGKKASVNKAVKEVYNLSLL